MIQQPWMRNNEKFRQSKFSNWLHGSRLKFFDIRNFSSLITEKDWKISTFEIFQYIKFWSHTEQNFYDRVFFQDRIFSTFNRVIFSTVRISTEKFRQLYQIWKKNQPFRYNVWRFHTFFSTLEMFPFNLPKSLESFWHSKKVKRVLPKSTLCMISGWFDTAEVSHKMVCF